jgi:hypothetical protein
VFLVNAYSPRGSVAQQDGDGSRDIAVGARFADGGGLDRGSVFVLFLHANRTVRSFVEISDNGGGFSGVLVDYDGFGFSVARLGDLVCLVVLCCVFVGVSPHRLIR